MESSEIDIVELGGKSLSIDEVAAVARFGARVELSKGYIERVASCRNLLERFVEENRIIYGVTTGFGDNISEIILEDKAAELQRNILMTHCCSVGEPLPDEVVRASMLVMLSSFGQGVSGVRVELAERIVDFLNKGITPVAPRHGSVGYLAVEAHIGLALVGIGRIKYDGKIMEASEALAKAGIGAFELSYKEGLCLTSGTTSPTALASLALYDGLNAVASADVIGAISLESLKGTMKAFDPRLMAVRPHPEQKASADNIMKLLEDSEIARKYLDYRLQDALSIRCIPQAHGAVRQTLKDALRTVETELNSCCDNPIIVKDGDSGTAISGCNPDAGFVGIEADSICIAMTYLAKMSERRTDRLVNRHLSELPAFLVKNPGLNNGFMIAQYSAVGLLGEMKILSHPSTVDGLPTCANQEDYVSMGYNAALKAYETSRFLEYVLSIELLTSLQAVEFHKPLEPSSTTKAILKSVRKAVPFMESDHYIYPDIEFAKSFVHDGMVRKIAEKFTGPLI